MRPAPGPLHSWQWLRLYLPCRQFSIKERYDVQMLGGTVTKADLTVGRVAPEIEGEDTDGRRFKLSEYRGKVVVVGFVVVVVAAAVVEVATAPLKGAWVWPGGT